MIYAVVHIGIVEIIVRADVFIVPVGEIAF
jgi:hypothetical protein